MYNLQKNVAAVGLAGAPRGRRSVRCGRRSGWRGRKSVRRVRRSGHCGCSSYSAIYCCI